MLIMRAEEVYQFSHSVKELADGDLLLHKIDNTLYFESNRIYCQYAGYEMNWKNYIGYQNVIFYARVHELKTITSLSGVEELTDMSVDEQKQFFERAIGLGIIYSKFDLTDSNAIRACELRNQIIIQSRILEERIKAYSGIEDMKADDKFEVYHMLLPLYAHMLMFKALDTPKFSSNECSMNNLLELSVENIEIAWHMSERK